MLNIFKEGYRVLTRRLETYNKIMRWEDRRRVTKIVGDCMDHIYLKDLEQPAEGQVQTN